MSDNEMKHLEFIQSVITRMNQNSFQAKGLMITIVSALLALYASESSVACFFIAIVPVVAFCLLDAYYLQQERKFRGIYDDVAKLTDEKERKEVRNFEMPIQKYHGGKYCYLKALFSISIFPLYGIILVGLVVAGIILF